VAGGAGQDEAPVDTAMPRLDACGGQVPLVADGAAAALDGESLADFACFAIDEPAFVKVGLISAAAADPADLRLSLHRFDDAGVPTFMATTDDAFGLDPELSIDL